jgi:Spy/CpxP family protein refolding chaperone
MISGEKRLKVWLVLFGVFLLGTATGAALAGIYHLRHRPAMIEPRGGHGDAFLERMRRELSLNDQQTAAVRSIVDDARNEFHALRNEARPRFEAIRQKERERLRALLTPDQQQRFDQMMARHDAMRDRPPAE